VSKILTRLRCVMRDVDDLRELPLFAVLFSLDLSRINPASWLNFLDLFQSYPFKLCANLQNAEKK
jgi:hypothetical protein